MNYPKTLALLGCAAGHFTALYAFKRPFRVYPSMEACDDIALPEDWREQTEWVFARLMYPQPHARFGRYHNGRWANWLEGGSSWTQDYPRADRHFAQARSVEQPVNFDDGDDPFNYPWINAAKWATGISRPHRRRPCASTCCAAAFSCSTTGGEPKSGTGSWRAWSEFPGSSDHRDCRRRSRFHVVYDLDERFQIAGQWAVARGTTCRNDGAIAHWRGIYDGHGRVMVAMSFNSDIGDFWEWADDPDYPEMYSSLGIRIGVNYVIYSMTH